MKRKLRLVFPLLVLFSTVACPAHMARCINPRCCRGAGAEVRAYVEAHRAKMKIVATTVTRRGSVYDWIDPRSQAGYDELAVPPPLDPQPGPPPSDDPIQPKQARSELEDEPEAMGPPGTVPILRPDLDHICASTVEEWLGVLPGGGLGPENIEVATPPP